ncbi:SusD-like starch-binding protein associating with outer membrane [Ancylomarina subtilis]|uniref:SusD-like starch-binding protein associating with outer membrane n=1 Tax=Ancylomarina subtilis TaxID=1639035 RepID=A0A4V2FT62_9BACT|nr:RagB/SusD family nutrient uptake outer membrane protein [Ancylomarina subtilis]RZT96955.1 SusD-like starch-binding protein associating with outer membrane [Ancylomarina subtilis]
MKNKFIYALVGLGLFNASCSESWLDENPSDKLSSEGSVQNVSQAQYAVDGIYNQMTDDEYYNGDYICNFDVMADDMRVTQSGRLDTYYDYSFYTESSDATMWERPYEALKNTAALMAVIDDIAVEGDDEIAARNDIKGQALALRGLIHFDLVKTFGKAYTHAGGPAALGVPIVTDVVQFDAKPARNTVEEVYTQVISDLKEGISLLKKDVNLGHINKAAAQAILARVYLYKGDMANALTYAEEVINNSGIKLMPRDKYISEWAANGMSESLFELVNSSEDTGGGYETVGYLSDPNGYGQFAASDDFIAKLQAAPYDVRSQLLAKDELSSDEKGDRMGRILKFPGKPDQPAYTTNTRVIRLSEVYLIAAEAALGTDKTKAANYLNAVIERAYPTEDVLDTDGTTILFNHLTDIPTVTAANITLSSVLEERRLELVSEGHRFFDLVRNNMTIVRGSDYWGTLNKTIEMSFHKIVQPIPRIELDANPNMKQNPGYDS